MLWVGNSGQVDKCLKDLYGRLPLLRGRVNIHFSERTNYLGKHSSLVVWTEGWIEEFKMNLWKEKTYPYPTSEEHMQAIANDIYQMLLPAHTELELMK